MKTRLLGIDLFRGLAAYAVILVHSGDATWGVPVDSAAESFRLLFYFAVPFFIATSFYLMVNRPLIAISAKFWRSKIERILIPYAFWTVIYIASKLIIFPLTNQTEQIKSIAKDVWGVIFFGGVSYHLYFLPLIFVGSFLAILARYFQQRKVSWKILCFLWLLSIIVHQVLVWSDNFFKLGPNVAFNSLLQFLPPDFFGYNIVRLVFVWLAWLLRCLPYLLTSMLYVNFQTQNKFKFTSQAAVLFWLSTFLSLDTWGKLALPFAFWEIAVSFSLLSLAIAISNYFKENRIIISLGQCSFGIYLIHPLIKSGIEIAANKFIPAINQSVSITSILFYSGLTFIVSWYVVSISIKNKLIAKYLFGV